MRDEAPIFRFNEQRPHLVSRTIDRVVDTTEDVLRSLNDAAYHETRRLDKARRAKDVERLAQWRSLAKRLGRMSEPQRRARLRELVSEYAHDIAGNFDPRVHKLSTRLIPALVTSLLSPSKLPRLVRHPQQLFSLDALRDKVVVQGNVDHLRKLAKNSTLIFVPTHSSNMDSIVFGFALERSRLPPATYGAGKNLFTNPLLSFFMHNLGAYKVDRRLRHRIYKDCLKAYSAVLIEEGYHSLFFPGGTRSRSGRIEQRLKLGLMGTGIEAYTRTLMANKERRVYFVPATINYLLTLEAESLIGDFLSEAGRERYIIEDDESSRLGRVTTFSRQLLGMNGSVVIRFGRPLDPFGCDVDEDGQSHDRRGRRIDPASYVRNLDGEVNLDQQRNAQYTRELGQRIADEYKRETVAMSTNIVAAACFEQLREHTGGGDLFDTLRVRDHVCPRDDLARKARRIRDDLLDLEKSERIHVAGNVRGCSGGDIVAQAMRAFRGYHTIKVLDHAADGLALRDPKLLFYYQNRLVPHGVAWDANAPRATPPAGAGANTGGRR